VKRGSPWAGKPCSARSNVRHVGQPPRCCSHAIQARPAGSCGGAGPASGGAARGAPHRIAGEDWKVRVSNSIAPSSVPCSLHSGCPPMMWCGPAVLNSSGFPPRRRSGRGPRGGLGSPETFYAGRGGEGCFAPYDGRFEFYQPHKA